jgi:uncharacterized protein YjbI with pentapeptide repeats
MLWFARRTMAETVQQAAERQLGLVNDAARAVSASFVTFFTVAVYVGVTILSTTDEMLVWGSAVTLPLLNRQIPISGKLGFYTIAPWLIVILHTYVLVQLYGLGTKVSHFQAAVTELPEEERGPVCERLTDFHYVQFLVRNGSSRFLHVVSALTLCTAMIIFPLALLCAMLIRFLPLHDPAISGWQQLAVFADVAIVLAFLWKPLSIRPDAARRAQERSARRLMQKLVSLRTVLVGTCAVVPLIVVVARWSADADPATSWFGRTTTLNLRETILVAKGLAPEVVNALGGNDVKRREAELEKVSRLGVLQGKDLRHADLFLAVLPRLDLRSRRVTADSDEMLETRLQGADLSWSQMQQVLLDGANLEGATLDGAQMQGGSLPKAILRSARLTEAQLQDAKLPGAHLDYAVLNRAHLEGADFSTASLQSAWLEGAQLQGASLREADLRDAHLKDAALQGADLSGARLEGADLKGVDLRGAILTDTKVTGADFENAKLEWTDVSRVKGASTGPGTGTFARVKSGPRASVAEVADGDCQGSDDDDDVHRLNEYLGTLACADAYVARGLIGHALSGHPERMQLAKKLAGTVPAACPGMELLPPGTRAALDEKLSPATSLADAGM